MQNTNRLLAASLAALLLGSVSRASEHDAIWDDPLFKRQFVASYGINAEVEPRLAAEEVQLLEKLRPLMADALPQAEELLKKSLKPDCSATLDFTLAGIQYQRDELVEALASYQRAVTRFPSFRRAWRNLGLIHVRQGDFGPGIAAFTRMIELGGGDAYSYGLLGYAYASQLDFQPAEAAYRNALLLQPENSEWRLGLTRCVFKQDKFQDAVSMLDVLLGRYPDKADFWLLQAHAFLGLKRPLDAAVDLEMLELLGKSTADTLQTLGDIYSGESLFDLALRAYERSIEVDSQQSIARPLRTAELLAARGAMKQSRKLALHVRSAWGERLEDADRRRLLKLEARLSMAEGVGTLETAAVLEELARVDPLDGEALLLLAQHYAASSETEKACLTYERAEGLESVELKARIAHAQLLVNQGRFADALPQLRRAQEIKPREDVARYLEQVERLAKARR